MIKREHYLSLIRPFYDSDLIKIITGIRRCGKSVILNQIKEELKKEGKEVLSLDFEDASVLYKIDTEKKLLNFIQEKKSSKKLYIFLDEIQRLDNWASACRTIRLYNCSLFITGSNSKLLSHEFTKELSGRYVSFKIRPFVYKELKEYALQLNKDITISDYLIWGGFPKRIEFDTLQSQKLYLNDLNETIIINDIISRYNIKKIDLFRKLTDYILLSNSRIFSVRSILKYINNTNIHCSINTLIKYINYLQEAFIIDAVKIYSSKTKSVLNYYQKLYDEDVSFNSLRVFNNQFDITHNLENIVYNELIYRGYSLQTYNNNNKEIDFIAIKNNKQYFIQVTYTLAEKKTYDREFSAFKNIDNNNQKIIISNDDFDYSTSTIKHISLKQFLELEDL